MPVLSHRCTVEEFHKLEGTGFFPPDCRVELLEGEIVDMLPAGPFHAGVTRRLVNFFIQVCGKRCLVDCQNPLRIGECSEPLPDVVLLRLHPDDYTSHHPAADDVLLIVEVADSSVAYDRNDKLPAYARAGIAEYWIVNLVSKCIEVYRNPHFAGYSFSTKAMAGDTVSPTAFPDLIVDVATVLRQSS